jgi:NADH:ubiquinone oxidoreductase subunit C
MGISRPGDLTIPFSRVYHLLSLDRNSDICIQVPLQACSSTTQRGYLLLTVFTFSHG